MDDAPAPEGGYVTTTGKVLRSKPGRKPGSKGKPPRPDKRPRVVGQRSLAFRLEESFTSLGVMVFAFNRADGEAIIGGANNLASALDRLAKQNPKVRDALERALAGTAWSGVIMALAGIAIPIATNHGLLPERAAALVATEAGESAAPPTTDPAKVDNDSPVSVVG